jgi:hypothetical protein
VGLKRGEAHRCLCRSWHSRYSRYQRTIAYGLVAFLVSSRFLPMSLDGELVTRPQPQSSRCDCGVDSYSVRSPSRRLRNCGGRLSHHKVLAPAYKMPRKNMHIFSRFSISSCSIIGPLNGLSMYMLLLFPQSGKLLELQTTAIVIRPRSVLAGTLYVNAKIMLDVSRFSPFCYARDAICMMLLLRN